MADRRHLKKSACVLAPAKVSLLLLSSAGWLAPDLVVQAHDRIPDVQGGSKSLQAAALQLAAKLSLEESAARGRATASGGCIVDGQWWDGADLLVSLATDGPVGPLQRVGAFENDVVPVEANCNGGEQPCQWTWAAGTASTDSGASGAAATINLTRSDGVTMEGSVTHNCSHISWQSAAGVAAGQWQNLNHGIERVHIVSMTHFDVGYTENSAEHLLDDFSQTWFPEAFNVSRTLRARGGEERFVWTSHPWLLWSYINNETGHVTPAQLADLDAAILAGDVIWHANPMNLQFESAEPSHMAEQLELTQRLRERYNMTSDSNVGTLAASNKDEPGATLGLIQQLASRGVKFMHIGVNDFSTVPAVPSSSAHFHGYCNAFVWRDDAAEGCNISSTETDTDAEVASGCEIITAMCSGYSKSFNLGHQVPSMEVLLPDMKDSLAFLMQVDNRGPPTVDQVLQGWADTQAKYPNAQLVTSSLDNFAQALSAKRRRDLRRLQHRAAASVSSSSSSTAEDARTKSSSLQAKAWALPVVSNKELGSTWIFGLASDATKLAWYRAAARARATFLESSPELKDDPAVQEFSRLLGKLPEHTAGSSGGGCTSPPFRTGAALNTCEPGSDPWKTVRTSYLDQRNYVWKAVQALGDSADGWRVIPNGAIACESPTKCLVPETNASGSEVHNCTMAFAAPTDPTPQCVWYGWTAAKQACGNWDECGGFWCDRGICWARSVAAMGPTGVPAPFDALGFGGAISWVRMSRATAQSPTPQQSLRRAVEDALADTQPDEQAATAEELTSAGLHSWVNPGSQAVQVGRATIDFSSTTGAIVGFSTNAGQGKHQWSSESFPLGLLRHAAHDEAQCNAFRDEYNLRQCASACGGCGFSKCGLGGNSTTSYKLEPTLESAWTDLPQSRMLKASSDSNVARFWFNYTFATPVRGEPPSSASLLVTVNDTSPTRHTSRHGSTKASGATVTASDIRVDFELQWWGKAPTREAESLWFSISPLVSTGNSSDADAGWLLDKLGRWVDPLETVVNGSRTVHHVWSGVRHVPASGRTADDWDVELLTLDAGLVSPSTPSLSPTGAFNAGEDGVPHPGTGGLHFNLFNNAWTTNYALFSQDTSNKFRWTLRFRV